MNIQAKKLLIATNNKGKLLELNSMLADIRFDIVGLADFAGLVEVEETGSTFEENARLKAVGYAIQTGEISLADDSGLEVEALDGRPGVLSARYGGEDLDFAGKMQKLLGELKATGSPDRRARFVCSMAVADEGGVILFTSNGICEGVLAEYPRGNGGFGYDPIFIPNDNNATFGELSEAVKQGISHRASAFSEIIPFLRHFMAV